MTGLTPPTTIREARRSRGVCQNERGVARPSGMTITTEHFEARARQRQLRPALRDWIYWYGTEFHGAGATHVTLVLRDLAPAVRDDPRTAEAMHWILVLGDGDACVTCYRRDEAARFLRRKCGDGCHRGMARAA